MVDERPQPVRPHRRRDLPVTEPRVWSRREPNQPSSRTNRSTPMDAAASARRVSCSRSVEVHRLPRVEDERPRGARCTESGPDRWWRTSALVTPSRPAGDQAATRVGAVYVSPGPSRTSPGASGLAPADDGRVRAGPLRKALDEVLVVAAPRDVDGPDLAVAEAEPGLADREEERGVRPGPTPATGPHERPVGERVPLRDAFVHPATGEVEHLVGPRRQRQERAQRAELQRGLVRAGRRGHRGRDGEHPVGVEGVAQLDDHLHRHGLGAHDRAVPVDPHGRGPPRRRGPAGAVRREARRAEPPVTGGRQDTQVPRVVEGVVGCRAVADEEEVRQGVVGQVGAPVQDGGKGSPSCTRTRQAPPPRRTVVVSFTPWSTPGSARTRTASAARRTRRARGARR